MTEHAVLMFQADHGLRPDALFGPKTKGKLDQVIEGDYKFGDGYILRVPLIEISRAPSRKKASSRFGRPRSRAPVVDDRGTRAASVADAGNVVGPVVGTCYAKKMRKSRGPDFRIRLERMRLADDAPLSLVSTDEAVVSVVAESLASEKHMHLNLRSAGTGVAKINVMYSPEGGDAVEIGGFTSVVRSPRMVKVQPFRVKINQAPPDPVVEAKYTEPPDDANFWNKVYRACDHIWWPKGIRYFYLKTEPMTVQMPFAGEIDSTAADLETLYKEAKSKYPKLVKQDRICLFIVKDIKKALGVTVAPAYKTSYPSVAIKSAGKTPVEVAIDLAHEFGHYLGLAKLTKYGHSDDDKVSAAEPDDEKREKKRRSDIWSIRHLLFSAWPSGRRKGASWAMNVGYGENQYGCLITERKLPQNPCDGETTTVAKQKIVPG